MFSGKANDAIKQLVQLLSSPQDNKNYITFSSLQSKKASPFSKQEI
jgi:hypothetical protein